MFDRFDPGENSASRSFRTRCMGGYGNARTSRNLDSQLQLIQREGGVGNSTCAPAIIGVYLDPICAFANLLTDHAREAVDAISFLGSLRYVPFRSVTLRAIAAGRHNRARCHDHSRAGYDSLLH